MARQAHEILADALDSASKLAVNNILQSRLIGEKQLTLLKKEGFLKPIVKGWYLLDPDLSHSDTGSRCSGTNPIGFLLVNISNKWSVKITSCRPNNLWIYRRVAMCCPISFLSATLKNQIAWYRYLEV